MINDYPEEKQETLKGNGMDVVELLNNLKGGKGSFEKDGITYTYSTIPFMEGALRSYLAVIKTSSL